MRSFSRCDRLSAPRTAKVVPSRSEARVRAGCAATRWSISGLLSGSARLLRRAATHPEGGTFAGFGPDGTFFALARPASQDRNCMPDRRRGAALPLFRRSRRRHRAVRSEGRRAGRPAAAAPEEAVHPRREPVHVQVEHRRDEQRQRLRHDQAADDRDAERLAQLALAPVPSAIGSVPMIAASVVIMIGRKRSRQASRRSPRRGSRRPRRCARARSRSS